VQRDCAVLVPRILCVPVYVDTTECILFSSLSCQYRDCKHLYVVEICLLLQCKEQLSRLCHLQMLLR